MVILGDATFERTVHQRSSLVRVPDSSRAMLRSQSGPLAIVPFTCCPVARHTTFDALVFRALLLHSPCPRPATFAGVAVHSTLVSTTVQHVLWRGVSVKQGGSPPTVASVNRISPDTAIHEQNGYAKLLDHKYNILMTNVDNDNSDTTYKHKHNMREV